MNRRAPCVLLISPGIIKPTDMDFGLAHLVSLGGYLEHHLKLRVELLDLAYEGGDRRQLERTLDRLGPFLLVGVSCYSSYDFMRVMTLARFVKDLYPEAPIVAGGYHASACAEEFVAGGSPFDAVVRGEGERGMRSIAEAVLGGAPMETRVVQGEEIEELDSLPPYRWELLRWYWPRASQLGSKLQIYLSRGCPHRCSFCMERAKGKSRWRAFSPGRAVEELERLAKFTPLERWVINVADPLFGFETSWRREVLSEIIARELRPRQFWTLTRAEGLAPEDVELLARARFSIGVGLESASPAMLTLMDKTRRPERYLAAMERLAAQSRVHGLSWAANIIIGHPGETLESMEETHGFVRRLFTNGDHTRGWLSVDPFRLYPGSRLHRRLDEVTRRHGATVHHPGWWRSWYDTAFRSEHVDPSAGLDYADRVRFTYARYGPLVREIAERFRGQGREVDSVFALSLEGQVEMMRDEMCRRLLRRAARVAEVGSRGGDGCVAPAALGLPIGLQVRDPWIRRREDAVRRLLEHGTVRSDELIEALLTVPPEDYLAPEEARAMLLGQGDVPVREGAVPRWLGIDTVALMLQARCPGAGERACDLLAARGYVTALLAALVGDGGAAVAVAGDRRRARTIRRSLASAKNAAVVIGRPTTARGLEGTFDALYLGSALPRAPTDVARALVDPGGELITALGPRFGVQDLVCLRRRGEALDERVLARVQLPVIRGPGGWLS